MNGPETDKREDQGSTGSPLCNETLITFSSQLKRRTASCPSLLSDESKSNIVNHLLMMSLDVMQP